MKNTLTALSITMLPVFAQAQSCIDIVDLQARWQDGNKMNTELVFSGQVDNGPLIYVFENTDNGRWSQWTASPGNPTCLRLFGQGADSKTEHTVFTTKAAPEHKL